MTPPRAASLTDVSLHSVPSPVPVPDLPSSRTRAPETRRVVNAMTVDVEDYFHVSAFDGVVPRSAWDRLESRVCANTERLLAIFDERQVHATFFILGWVAERFPLLVRRIAAMGHEIASHGYAHRLVYDQTPAAFRDDVRRAKSLLESTAGVPVHGFRAPSYSITPRSLWALDTLIEEGYTYDTSIFPVHHDRYGIPLSARHPYWIHRPAGSILEVPGSTLQCQGVNLPFGGGGYFRLLPYAWARWGMERLNSQEGRSAVFYLHPWEIDPDQPRLPGSALSQFRHYRNLDKTETRLRRLLAEFAFAPLRSTMEVASVAANENVHSLGAPLPYHW
jgi:polysaccharide deacetylase family protein (PEP-CTERM system associated)